MDDNVAIAIFAPANTMSYLDEEYFEMVFAQVLAFPLLIPFSNTQKLKNLYTWLSFSLWTAVYYREYYLAFSQYDGNVKRQSAEIGKRQFKAYLDERILEELIAFDVGLMYLLESDA